MNAIGPDTPQNSILDHPHAQIFSVIFHLRYCSQKKFTCYMAVTATDDTNRNARIALPRFRVSYMNN